MRKVLFLLLSVLIVWVPFSAHFLDEASASNHKLNEVYLLEITDDGHSTGLDFSNASQYNVKVDTVSMKKFVASREEIDGKYDGIIIGEGTYSTQEVNGRNHNTSNVQNDITNYKANQIINHFAAKNQPVFLHGKSMENGGILQQKFSGLNSSSVIYYGNEIVTEQENCRYFWIWYLCDETVSTSNGFSKVFENYMNESFIKKPSFEVASKPAVGNASFSNVYKAGDSINFSVNVHNSSVNRMKLRLYIDQDFNDSFEPEEIVKEIDVRGNENVLNYELPFGFSGPRMWKLELVQPQNNYVLSDYETGQFLFEDKPVEINVLQVYRNSNSSLKNSNNMKQSYLTSNNQYQINIDATSFDVFNSSANASSQSRLYSHEKINGKYDMVIFGFSDTYNYANLSQGAVGSLKQYIDSQQSVMFTHDTIFNRNNVWVDNFMETTGQIAPETNLGNGAPNTSKSTKKVNEGLMTTFPFDLPENVSIATTHNQYYTLDLEDENVIPWYNIIGSNRDEDDSWNHFYTYSKGNVTYSGTGHTSSNFPDSEQRLFVNTMYRAFFGANHAPEINVHTPQDDERFPINQKIPLSFTVEDYDLSAKTNNVEVFVNDLLTYTKENSRNGETINLQLEHGVESEGPVVIRIVATDEKGAETIEERTVSVYESESLLEISRSIQPVKSIYEVVNDVIELDYTLNPKPVRRSEIKGNQTAALENIEFEEVFPAGIEILNLPAGFTKSGDIDSGYTVKGLIKDINYSKDFNGDTPDNSPPGGWRSADPVNFTIAISALQGGSYSLSDSAVVYDVDYLNESFTETFNRIDFTAGYPLEEVNLTESITIDEGLERNLTASGDFSYGPAEAAIEKIEWESSRPDVITVTQDGIIRANGKGDAVVTVSVTDSFGNQITKTSNVSVRVPIESISLDNVEVFAGETVDLPLTVNPSDGSGSIEITLENNEIASVNAATRKVTGLKPGTTKAIARGINANGTVVTAEAIIQVRSKEITGLNVEPGEITINKYETFDSFTVSVEPQYAETDNLTWTSANASIAEMVSPGVIRGVGAGRTVIYIQAPNGIRDEVTVNVTSPLTDAGFVKDVIVIGKGDTYPLATELQITPADATDIESIIYTDVTNDGPNPFITVDNNGEVFGQRIGENNTVRVTVTTNDGNIFTDTIIIHVREKDDEESPENGDRY
ncbi:DUF5057 domain-containing protein [Jeotgalibacillus salarius]|uniref:DUF5057 domain-containing protein n=1 Tax=Jeotgalibacillus salarius TaxID=546023 RepID=A0A4Y8LK81_9BACL|nr:DUF5057 domain-containing protein [Jeotgalibacillus salarius]TFE01008.1 DUF5057 domain-containing protein [Jeotgalibacillus salarius]